MGPFQNRCPVRDRAENLALDWVQFLPGKRESRRFIGDHVLTQNDVEAEGRFPDIVAYGGWAMDDHHPAGFWAARMKKEATIFHPGPSPYGIPFRSLYSANIDNLMFAGRNASCTHSAMSSSRNMGTCITMGQAVGTAAYFAIKHNTNPRGVNRYIRQLQQTLIEDDCYLPWVKHELPPLTKNARLEGSQGDPEAVRDGFYRQIDDDPHCWIQHPGDMITYQFEKAVPAERVTLVLDSAMEIENRQSLFNTEPLRVAEVMPKRFRIQALQNGSWNTLYEVKNNYQRQVRFDIKRQVEGIRYILDETWGADKTRLYGFYVS